MRWRTSSCSKASFMPRAFAPPQPKHPFSGLGSSFISLLGFLFWQELVAQASACVLWISQVQTAHRLKSVLPKPLRANLSRGLNKSSLDQRDAGHLRAAGSALALAHFDAQDVGQRGNAAGDFALIEAGKTEPQRVGHRVLQVKITSRGEHNAPFTRMNQELVRIEPRRKLDPYGHPAFRARPFRALRHVPPENVLKRSQPGAVCLPGAFQMAAQKSPAHVFR